MTRSALEKRWARSEPITTLIIQGRWHSRRFPGSRRFAANCKKLAGAYGGKGARPHHDATIGLFALVERRSRILDEICAGTHHVVELLLRIVRHRAHWVRPLEPWRPERNTGFEQLSELVRHLLERYPAPAFFERAWLPPRGARVDWIAFEWYLHVAQGGNIRTAPGLPVTLNRRAAHALSEAPAKLTPRDALRWAQIRGAGVPSELMSATVPLVPRDWEQSALWVALLDKLGTAPELRPEQVGPLVDYVHHRARQPAFTLKGQSIASLLRAMDRWHAELGRERAARTLNGGTDPNAARWTPLPETEGLTEVRDAETWTIQELVSFSELFEEGRRMHHCVATYAGACARGTASIWSLRIARASTETSRVTVRVDVASRYVMEARRFANARISRDEYQWIRRWAGFNRLSVSSVWVLPQ